MSLLDITNLVAAFYKGYYDAAGIQTNCEPMVYIAAGTTMMSGIHRGVSAVSYVFNKKSLDEILDHRAAKFVLGPSPRFTGNVDPVGELMVGTSQRMPLTMLELAAGYALGYGMKKAIG